ncbi:hypothetical protein B7494_g5565 [Chlorociboria aeruginascens]|nr:hypothetical protein B7494_g5565 [Chlorociboria aeruginascens]
MNICIRFLRCVPRYRPRPTQIPSVSQQWRSLHLMCATTASSGLGNHKIKAFEEMMSLTVSASSKIKLSNEGNGAEKMIDKEMSIKTALKHHIKPGMLLVYTTEPKKGDVPDLKYKLAKIDTENAPKNISDNLKERGGRVKQIRLKHTCPIKYYQHMMHQAYHMLEQGFRVEFHVHFNIKELKACQDVHSIPKLYPHLHPFLISKAMSRAHSIIVPVQTDYKREYCWVMGKRRQATTTPLNEHLQRSKNFQFNLDKLGKGMSLKEDRKKMALILKERETVKSLKGIDNSERWKIRPESSQRPSPIELSLLAQKELQETTRLSLMYESFRAGNRYPTPLQPDSPSRRGRRRRIDAEKLRLDALEFRPWKRRKDPDRKVWAKFDKNLNFYGGTVGPRSPDPDVGSIYATRHVKLQRSNHRYHFRARAQELEENHTNSSAWAQRIDERVLSVPKGGESGVTRRYQVITENNGQNAKPATRQDLLHEITPRNDIFEKRQGFSEIKYPAQEQRDQKQRAQKILASFEEDTQPAPPTT